MFSMVRRGGLLLAVCAFLTGPMAQLGKCDSVDVDVAIADALRECEIARLKLTRYDQVDYPLQIRRLDTQLKLAEAERDVWRKRVQEYSTLENWTGPTGLLITLDDARLTELRLSRMVDDLREERELSERNHFDQRRLFKLEVDAAASRVARLRGIRAGLIRQAQ